MTRDLELYLVFKNESAVRQEKFLSIIKKDPKKKWNCLNIFFGEQKTYFRTSFLENNFNTVKQDLYNLFLLQNERVDYNKSEQFRGGPSLVHFALMCCDNLAARTAFLKWSYDKEHRGRHIVSLATFLQKVLSGADRSTLETEIQHYEKNFFGFIYGGHKGRGDVFQKDVAFMKAILEKDESTIRDWFDFILQPEINKLRVYSDDFNSKYLSLPGATMLKLCWHLGMEIHIDSPYIPMELMPFKPLDKYDVPYFFLDGYEGEIPQSYLDWQKEQSTNLKSKQDIKTEDSFEWDKNKYGSRQEAIIVEQALDKGFIVESHGKGNWSFYKKDKNGKKERIGRFGKFDEKA